MASRESMGRSHVCALVEGSIFRSKLRAKWLAEKYSNRDVCAKRKVSAAESGLRKKVAVRKSCCRVVMECSDTASLMAGC